MEGCRITEIVGEKIEYIYIYISEENPRAEISWTPVRNTYKGVTHR